MLMLALTRGRNRTQSYWHLLRIEQDYSPIQQCLSRIHLHKFLVITVNWSSIWIWLNCLMIITVCWSFLQVLVSLWNVYSTLTSIFIMRYLLIYLLTGSLTLREHHRNLKFYNVPVHNFTQRFWNQRLHLTWILYFICLLVVSVWCSQPHRPAVFISTDFTESDILKLQCNSAYERLCSPVLTDRAQLTRPFHEPAQWWQPYTTTAEQHTSSELAGQWFFQDHVPQGRHSAKPDRDEELTQQQPPRCVLLLQHKSTSMCHLFTSFYLISLHFHGLYL